MSSHLSHISTWTVVNTNVDIKNRDKKYASGKKILSKSRASGLFQEQLMHSKHVQ